MTEMEKYIDAVKTIVDRNVRNFTPTKIRAEIEEYRRRANVSRRVAKEVMAAIEDKIVKLDEGMLSEWLNRKVDTFATLTTAAYQEMEGKIAQRLYQTIDRALRERMTDDQIIKMLARDTNTAERHLYTLRTTTTSVVNRIKVTNNALNQGAEWFRYGGRVGGGNGRNGTAVRPFCQKHIDGVYNLKEIEGMSNGQGLDPVLYYCGGYNCVHRWQPVTIETARAARPEMFE